MRVIITGSTGMVGKGVLFQCMEDDRIKEILLINRTSLNMNHPKVKELLCEDFLELEKYKKEFDDYDGCFHCMGMSAVGAPSKLYYKVTYEMTKILTDLVYQGNKKAVFNYVTGEGTDSKEKSPIEWARVKGKAENYILNKGFKDAYMFRAGVIIPEKGIKSRTPLYNFFYVLMWPFFPLMKLLPFITTTSKIGDAMIYTLFNNEENKIINNLIINRFSKRIEK